MRMTLKTLVDTLSKEMGVDLRCAKRDLRHVAARAIYYDIAYNHMSLGSLSLVGQEVGKHHATVLHSIRTVIPQMEKYFPKEYELGQRLKDGLDIVRPISKDKQILALSNKVSELTLKLVDPDACVYDPYIEVVSSIRRVPESKLEVFKTRLEALITTI